MWVVEYKSHSISCRLGTNPIKILPQIYKCVSKHKHNEPIQTFAWHYVKALYLNIFIGIYFSQVLNRQFRHFILQTHKL